MSATSALFLFGQAKWRRWLRPLRRWYSQSKKPLHTSNDRLSLNYFLQKSKLNLLTTSNNIINDISSNDPVQQLQSYLDQSKATENVFIETYGCQMNVSDTEIIRSVLTQQGYSIVESVDHAHIVLLNTCAIRDNAEQKIWRRLEALRSIRRARLAKLRRSQHHNVHSFIDNSPYQASMNDESDCKSDEEIDTKAAVSNCLDKNHPSSLRVGVLGCMAERLKTKLLEEEALVDIVVGPDAYRDLPRLLHSLHSKDVFQQGDLANVQLSIDETYADIAPTRSITESNLSAYVSITRGCNNMCAFCIVPYTRGRERSRSSQSIIDEVCRLRDQGFKEIILLGQNVNSYRDMTTMSILPGEVIPSIAEGFTTKYKLKDGGIRFAELLDMVSSVDSEVRVRYTSPHPKDFTDDVIQLVSERANICKSMHIPAQSGSSRILEKMRRGYTRESYLNLIEKIRYSIPNISLSSDFISGFCDETNDDHQDTLSLLQLVEFSHCFCFYYSMRDKTYAHHHYNDNVLLDVKLKRLNEVIQSFQAIAKNLNEKEVFEKKRHLVLVEGTSRRSDKEMSGRTDTNKKIIFGQCQVPLSYSGDSNNNGNDHDKKVGTPLGNVRPGDYVVVEVTSSTFQTLRGNALARTTIEEFSHMHSI